MRTKPAQSILFTMVIFFPLESRIRSIPGRHAPPIQVLPRPTHITRGRVYPSKNTRTNVACTQLTMWFIKSFRYLIQIILRLSGTFFNAWVASHSSMSLLISRKFSLSMKIILYTTWIWVISTFATLWKVTSLLRSSYMWIFLRLDPRFCMMLLLSSMIPTLRSWKVFGASCMMWSYPILLTKTSWLLHHSSGHPWACGLCWIPQSPEPLLCYTRLEKEYAMTLRSGSLKTFSPQLPWIVGCHWCRLLGP